MKIDTYIVKISIHTSSEGRIGPFTVVNDITVVLTYVSNGPEWWTKEFNLSINNCIVLLAQIWSIYNNTCMIIVYQGLCCHSENFISDLNDDVMKLKHFPRYWSFVRGIHQSPVNSPHKGQWSKVLIFSLICAWTNGSANNRGAGDLKCQGTNYDVNVMRPLVALQP